MKRILVLVLLFPWQPVQAQTCQARDVCEMGPIMGWDLSEGAPIQIRKISTGIITDSTFKKYALGATFFGSACPNSMQKPVAVSVTGKFKEARPSPTDERVIRRSPLVTEPLVRPHTGLDYGCSDGNAIHPMADGRVISTADSSTYGEIRRPGYQSSGAGGSTASYWSTRGSSWQLSSGGPRFAAYSGGLGAGR